MKALPASLAARIERLARAPVLLVATDFDGTLSPIVSDPALAFPYREALVAVRRLASLPQTHVAIVSGRSLSELARLTGAPENVDLVGSHGSEFDPGFAANLAPAAVAMRSGLRDELLAIAGTGDGFHVEEKPAGAAFHYRNAPADAAERAVAAVLAGPAARDGVHTRHGKMVLELSVLPTNKGHALQTLRGRVGADAAMYLGDDATDEDAFATLSGPDVAIKVGEGETCAPHRVTGPEEATRVLAMLSELREAWLRGPALVPIEHHSLLSDQRTCALVTPGARISWLCVPRIDSAPIFAELVGGTTAGYFAIEAADGSAAASQEYRRDSLQLTTRWRAPKGSKGGASFTVTDYLDCSLGRPTQRAGRTDLVRVISGRGRVRIEFAPRLDFGRFETRFEVREDGLGVAGSPDPIVLRAPGVEWTLEEQGLHQTARAEVELGREPVVLELRAGTGSLKASVVPELERRQLSHRFWAGWAATLDLPDLATELVLRSALTLRALCYGPSGAIAAAATTSLPEHLGGVRNWDYRYAWLRDAALSAEALVRLGSLTEAMRYLDWVQGILETGCDPERLRPLYLVTGSQLGPEAEISELSGYGGSRPVRVGNGASTQVQLDVFGPIVQLVDLLLQQGAPLSSEHWRLVEAMVLAVERRWKEPDHGIWELRGPRRHHVHSKVMCWLTVDRALAVSERLLGRERAEWHALRDSIAADVLKHGWSEEIGAFTAAYGETALDASSLCVGTSGLLPPEDPRFVATVEAIERALRDGPTVYRYRMDDGLPGTEGGFHLCASWLVDALLLVGRREDAVELFHRLCALVGPTGLLSEQIDPATGTALGNHPQAYSHLGLVHNALNLERGLLS